MEKSSNTNLRDFIEKYFSKDNYNNLKKKLFKVNLHPKLKDGFSMLLLLCLFIFAIIQKMEILSIVLLVFIFSVIYKQKVSSIIETGLELIRKAQLTKLGKIELTVDKEDYSKFIKQKAEWMQIIVSQLNSDHIGLLLSIYKAEKYPAKSKEQLRVLRKKGLLLHNAPSLEKSTEVWLSELGKELAANLFKEKIK